MKKYFTYHFKKLIYLYVLIGFSFSSAGSYEDFFTAVRQDKPRDIQALLARGFDANTVDPKGQRGLHLALLEPSPQVAQALIDWPKTDVNALNPSDESALMLAALKGHQALAERLISKGADVNKTGWTPLHYAASAGHTDIIGLLLEHHAYIDAESPNGTTPLMMAAMYGTSEAVMLLLKEGADPRLKNHQGLSALQFAERASRPDAIEAIAAAIRNQRPAGQW